LLVVLQRAPIPTDCAARWRRDYAARCYAGNTSIDLVYRAAKAQEPIGPFYEDLVAPISNKYPVFLTGKAKELSYFEEPMSRTLYYFSGSSFVHQVPVLDGKVAPGDLVLPSHLSLSLLTQTQVIDEGKLGGGSLVDTQAYFILYPKFKQIVNVSDGNARILGLAMQAMRDMQSMVLSEAAGKRSNSTTDNGGRKRFTSSNLALDAHAKSNKRIRPLGERGYKNKKN
jgi:hypothetical protein